MHVISLVLSPASHVEAKVEHGRRLTGRVVEVHGSAQVVLAGAAVTGAGHLVHLQSQQHM